MLQKKWIFQLKCHHVTFSSYLKMYAEKDSLEPVEVLRLPRKIALRSLVCEESSLINISCSSLFVIDDITISERTYYKLTVESWARHSSLNLNFLECKMKTKVHLYLFICSIYLSITHLNITKWSLFYNSLCK